MKKLSLIITIFILFASITGFAKTEQTPLQQKISELFKYRSAIVSYLGPEGTYTQEACEKFFGKRCIFKPFKTVNDAVSLLTKRIATMLLFPRKINRRCRYRLY